MRLLYVTWWEHCAYFGAAMKTNRPLGDSMMRMKLAFLVTIVFTLVDTTTVVVIMEIARILTQYDKQFAFLMKMKRALPMTIVFTLVDTRYCSGIFCLFWQHSTVNNPYLIRVWWRWNQLFSSVLLICRHDDLGHCSGDCAYFGSTAR